MDSPYSVVGSPNYAAPVVNWSQYLNPQQQQQKPGQPGDKQPGFLDKLSQFLHGPQSPVPGQPTPLQAPTPQVGQAGSPYAGPVAPPTPNMPSMNAQGLGLY